MIHHTWCVINHSLEELFPYLYLIVVDKLAPDFISFKGRVRSRVEDLLVHVCVCLCVCVSIFIRRTISILALNSSG